MFTNCEKYHFDQFTLTRYYNLLEIAKKNYKFMFFTDSFGPDEKAILLRHDLEFSPELAYKMALIEKALNINSTTFVNIHSQYYNVFESETFNIITEMIKLGNHVGVHLDTHFYDIKSEKELEFHLEHEKGILESYFNFKIGSFSFHNTNQFVLSFSKETYAGLLNVYSSRFHKEIGYCADSTGYWRFENMFDRLRDATDRVIQVLIHDGMWQEEVLPPRRRIHKVIDDKAKTLKEKYDNYFAENKLPNIDWKD